MKKGILAGALFALSLQAQLAPIATAEEAERLTFMREEEKLARDVYHFLYTKWNLRIFDNISRSEQTHFDQIGILLARYNLPDPAAGRAPGEFTNPRFASLYAELTLKGSLSVADALEVGVLIEKTDIDDLETSLTVTRRLDMRRVFRNLLNASDNHLDAFETVLEAVKAT